MGGDVTLTLAPSLRERGFVFLTLLCSLCCAFGTRSYAETPWLNMCHRLALSPIGVSSSPKWLRVFTAWISP